MNPEVSNALNTVNRLIPLVEDAYMISKIMSSLDQIRKLKSKLYTVKSRLEQCK